MSVENWNKSTCALQFCKIQFLVCLETHAHTPNKFLNNPNWTWLKKRKQEQQSLAFLCVIALKPNQLSACLIHICSHFSSLCFFNNTRKKKIRYTPHTYIHTHTRIHCVFSNSNFVSIASFFSGPISPWSNWNSLIHSLEWIKW